MLDKIKDLGAQVATKANEAVKTGIESLSDTAATVNERTVRTSTAQMCRILEIALEEVKARPLATRPLSLTATVNFGIATLEMQVHLEGPDKVLLLKTRFFGLSLGYYIKECDGEQLLQISSDSVLA